MIDLDFTAKFIASFEGFVGTVYLDAVGVETIGYGETRSDVIERYRGCGISQADAFELLKRRVQEFADAVERCITNGSALTPSRHAAFTSLAYNIGVGGFAESTACKRFNDGDLAGVPEAIGWWNKGGGQVLEGLTRRRGAEAALFETDGPPALGGTPSFIAPPSDTLREGDQGDRVRQAQQRLAERGWAVQADGVFGPATTEAVRAFQGQAGLVADGILGHASWQALFATSTPTAPEASECPPWPGRLMRQGLDGDDVRRAQARLSERGWGLVTDGQFGPKTDAVVRTYQGEKVLVVDGVVGPVTWQSIWTAPVT